MALQTLPDERITQKLHEDMLMGLMKYIGEWGIHEKYNDAWGAMREDADQFMQRMWAKECVKDTDRLSFLIAHRAALKPLMNVDTAIAIVKERGDDVVDAAKLREVYGSAIGQALFREEAMECQFEEFKLNVEKRLVEAELEHFTKDVVTGFRQCMLQATKQLVQAGHKPWEKKSTCPFGKTFFVCAGVGPEWVSGCFRELKGLEA